MVVRSYLYRTLCRTLCQEALLRKYKPIRIRKVAKRARLTIESKPVARRRKRKEIITAINADHLRVQNKLREIKKKKNKAVEKIMIIKTSGGTLIIR